MALSSYFFESGNQSRFFVIIVVVCVTASAVCIVFVSISIGFLLCVHPEGRAVGVYGCWTCFGIAL